MTYAEARKKVRSLAQALLDRDLSAERPLVILSGNDIEHALLGLGAMYAGIPYSPISPAYSLASSGYEKLRSIISLLTPGVVFAASGTTFANAIQAVVPEDIQIATTSDAVSGRPSVSLADLMALPETDAVDRAHEAVGPDTIAKFLFTSGSTGLPKAVINTQRMLCSNLVMQRQCLASLQDEPPVVVDWLPWNHTFGGNHNLGMVLYNGGSLYIDEGRPTPAGISATVRNLREIGPTIYLNVPKGFEALAPFLRKDRELRETFFSRLKLMFYAGAGISRHVWDELEAIAYDACGERILMVTGLGATETAPFALWCDHTMSRSGAAGIPSPGMELKLYPVAGKLEGRLRGPNITPGYWRQDHLTAAAFDEEGFYRLGDGFRFFDPEDLSKGLDYDGRITEDFKLATGTWVSVGPLRAKLIAHMAPFAQDAIIAGLNRGDVRALVFPDIDACRGLCDGDANRAASDLLRDEGIRKRFSILLRSFAEANPGSSTTITGIVLLEEPPSIDSGELTDKGTISQRAVLEKRAALVELLYASSSRKLILL